jgi:hypothetical protein
LQGHRDYPSVSVPAPIHQSAPSNKQPDQGKKTWSVRRSAAFALPFRLEPRATVDEIFATRDLVYALNHAAPYRVLVLGHTTRLYHAWTDVLDEHTARPFPMTRCRPGLSRRPGVGVERNLAFLHKVTAQPGSVVDMFTGNHDWTRPRALGKLVPPVFESGATARRTEALVRLDSAAGVNCNASGIAQVWRAAAGGKCKTLLVEKDLKYPADVVTKGLELAAILPIILQISPHRARKAVG